MRWITFLWLLLLSCAACFNIALWQHKPFAATGFTVAAIITGLLIERESR